MFQAPAASFKAATPATLPECPPMRPWEYIRLRREAAGLSIHDVAAALCPPIARRQDAVKLIELLESRGWRANKTRTLDLLARIFPFDPGVYRQLVEEPAERHPAICRGCGCSYWDRERGNEHACVSWTPPYTCSACASDEVSA